MTVPGIYAKTARLASTASPSIPALVHPGSRESIAERTWTSVPYGPAFVKTEQPARTPSVRFNPTPKEYFPSYGRLTLMVDVWTRLVTLFFLITINTR